MSDTNDASRSPGTRYDEFPWKAHSSRPTPPGISRSDLGSHTATANIIAVSVNSDRASLTFSVAEDFTEEYFWRVRLGCLKGNGAVEQTAGKTHHLGSK